MEYDSYADIKLFGCTKVSIKNLYEPKYSEGDVLFLIHKAKQGILEKVAIKKINIKFIYNDIIFIYKDTFNFLHNEEDLCSYNDAWQFVVEYKNNHSKDASKKCSNADISITQVTHL